MSTATTYPPLHRPAGTGPMYWGPGDLYTFLVTGEESGGAYFAMEALVPPGGTSASITKYAPPVSSPVTRNV